MFMFMFELLPLVTVIVVTRIFVFQLCTIEICVLRFFFFHPEEDREVGRNVGVLYNVSYLHLCLIYCFMKKTSTRSLK